MSLYSALQAANRAKYPDEYYNFNDGTPSLKQGYSTSGSIGGSKKVYTIKGKKAKYKRWGGGKDSYKWTGGTPDINIYKLPGQQAAPAPDPPAPDPPAPLMPTISDESKEYRAESERILAEATKKSEDFDASEAAATKAREIADETRIRDFVAKQKADQAKQKADQAQQKADQATQSENLARSNQQPNLQIQSASSTPKTGGTQAFKKRKIASNRKQLLTSGINLGTSSLLNI